MDRKAFKSRLFRRNISEEHIDFWQILYAEILFRIKELDDLNCQCSFCMHDRIRLKSTLQKMIKDKHIPENPKPKNFTGIGDCGRKLGPAA